MNAKIAMQKKLKAKYGVTFTSNMSIVEILEAWNRIPSVIKSALPSVLNVAMQAAVLAINTDKTLNTTYKTAKKIYITCQEAIETGVATIGGQPQQAVLKGASIVAKQAGILEDKAVQSMSDVLLNKLDQFA